MAGSVASRRLLTPRSLRDALRMLGTDFPYGWTTQAVDHILGTPTLTNSQREAILGGNAARLLGLKEAALGRV